MAEIKNSFLGAKMNKDIDDRILPSNEYRNAVNLQVNKSENSDVGSLQTVLGNGFVLDFNLETSSENLTCIGNLVDTANNRVFLFLTNNDQTNYSPTSKNFIISYNVSTNDYNILVQGSFLNFSKKNPVIGINILEDLLFWTDNRNQPRKISISKAINLPSYYNIEDQISVAKINPVYAIELFRELPLTGEAETTMYDVTSENLPDGVPNPYYDPNYIGDPSYLEDKFVRFSYRFKFDQNEYSIFAPFTQIAYIPKQDGYFLYTPDPDPLVQEPLLDDETAAYRSSVVSFMYNKVNNIFLIIKLPCQADELYSKYKITDIEILYKESDGLAVQVVDVISSSDIVAQVGSGDTYAYNYQSKKPFKVLPESDIIRVYDKTPVKALSQEIIGNRVVYGNYQDKLTYPKYLNYNVACNEKATFNVTSGTTSIIEYPNHSVKQNRNYQVGVVLSDKFGRQSGVILSNAFETTDLLYGTSSLYVPYNKETTPGSGIPAEGLVNRWPGLSLKVLFNNPIDGGSLTSWPGIYNGDIDSPDYNPLGWYSYKIVVKQTEQDYYNVYLPGFMASYPDNSTKELGKTSHIVLIGDNINKIPRDLTEISGTQEQYRSSVKLYTRVNNNNESWDNQQFYPGNTFAIVNTIATNSSMFSTPVPLDPPASYAGYFGFYQVDSNPLIGRVTTDSKIGITYNDPDPATVIRLAICETEPFESKIDIYWETSTSGIISELNERIISDTGAPSNILNWNFYFNEAADLGSIIVEDFYFSDILGIPLPIDLTNISLTVTNQSNIDRTDWFDIVQTGPDTFNLITNDYFYYGPNADVVENFNFNFQVTVGTTTVNILKYGALSNELPIISDTPTSYINLPLESDFIWQFSGVNGSNSLGGNDTLDLTWSVPTASLVETQEQVDIFEMSSTGELYNTDINANGTYLITVRLTDAGGLYVDFNVTVIFSSLNGVSVVVEEGDVPDYYWTYPGPTKSSRGYITVQPGVTVRVYADAGSFSIPGNGTTTQVTVFTSPSSWVDLISSSFEGIGGGLSNDYQDLTDGSFSFEVYVSSTGGGGSGGMVLIIQ